MSYPSTSLTHILLAPSVVYVPFVEPSVDLDLVLVRPQALNLEADRVFAEAFDVEEWALNAVNGMVGVDVDERWVAVVGIVIVEDFAVVDQSVVKGRPWRFASTLIHPPYFSDEPHCLLEHLVAFQRQPLRNGETSGSHAYQALVEEDVGTPCRVETGGPYVVKGKDGEGMAERHVG